MAREARNGTSEPLVGIGLCVRNGAKYLRESLDSLLAQTHSNFEILISDNASSDDTPKICAEYASKDKRIRYVRQSENIGSFGNHDFVYRESRGDYFLYASDDDLWHPKFIEECLAALQKDAGAVAAFSDFSTFDDSGRVMRYFPEDYFPFPKDLYSRLQAYILSKSKYGKGTIIYGLSRKNTPADRILMDTHKSDMIYVFELLSFGHFVHIPKMLFFKRLPVVSREKLIERKASLKFLTNLPPAHKYETVDEWLKSKESVAESRGLLGSAKEMIGNRLQAAKYFYLYSKYSLSPRSLTLTEKMRLLLWSFYAFLRSLWHGYM